MTLNSLIRRNKLARVAPRERLTNRVLGRLLKYESSSSRKGLIDEEVWTLLFVYGFVAGRKIMTSDLASALTEKKLTNTPQAWLEMMPIPPRQGVSGGSERNSRIDLLLGDITNRGSMISGVKFNAESKTDNGWVCFVEAKWLGDIASKTTHDWGRNQLARVIETALTFQGDGQWPARVHVTLLTPAVFKSPHNRSAVRFYAYKWREYVSQRGRINKKAIIADVKRSLIPIRNNTKIWTYPDLNKRLECLSMHWITYEELLSAMPQTRFKSALCEFVKQETQLLQSRKVT